MNPEAKLTPIDNDKLIWLFQTLLKEGQLIGNGVLMVPVEKLTILPYFDSVADPERLLEILSDLIGPMQNDKDFYQENNMLDYKPEVTLDMSKYYSPHDVIMFSDFTNNLISSYMEDRLGVVSGKGKIIKKTKKTDLQLPDLPKNLSWSDITIRFLNGDEVHLTVKERTYQSDYELMGFQNNKTARPNTQWALLKALAKKEGFIDWSNNGNMSPNIVNNLKKQKQSLSEKLKEYFHTIEDDPFSNYRSEGGYKIKLNLIPEQDGLG